MTTVQDLKNKMALQIKHPLLHEMASAITTVMNKPHMYDIAQVQALYELNVIASSMGVKVEVLPNNPVILSGMYLVQASSGAGKGYGSALATQMGSKFRDIYEEDVTEHFLQEAKTEMVQKEMDKTGELYTEAVKVVDKYFTGLGKLPYVWSRGTPAGMSQARVYLSKVKIGILNGLLDEYGAKWEILEPLLYHFLALYDGIEPASLLKNSKDSPRVIPDNVLVPIVVYAMGTASSIVSGTPLANRIDKFFSSGGGRRTVMAINTVPEELCELTPVEAYKAKIASNASVNLDAIEDKLGLLGNISLANTVITIPFNIGVIAEAYSQLCATRAMNIDTLDRSIVDELKNRHVKLLKIAAVLSFCSMETSISEDTIYAAIEVLEISGKAYATMRNIVPVYQLIVEYLVEIGIPMTQEQILKAFPDSFGATKTQRVAMMDLGKEFSIKEGIELNTVVIGDIIHYEAIALEPNTLESIIVSVMQGNTEKYSRYNLKFNEIHKLTYSTHRWSNHHLMDCGDKCNRNEESVVEGCNLVVLDLDGTVTSDEIRYLMPDLKYHLYTTMSHVEGVDPRYRMLIPLSHTIKLDRADFNEFMFNLADYLPFTLDVSGIGRCKQWASHKGKYMDYDGELLNVFQFLPTTAKPTMYPVIKNPSELDKLEAWFVKTSDEGQRNNMLFRYAVALISFGYTDKIKVEDKVKSLNKRFKKPLRIEEVDSTVMKKISKSLT